MPRKTRQSAPRPAGYLIDPSFLHIMQRFPVSAPAQEQEPAPEPLRAIPARPDALWFTDNGAVLCAKHVGATARMTGRDISGQPIERVTDADRHAALASGWHIACERCTDTLYRALTDGEGAA